MASVSVYRRKMLHVQRQADVANPVWGNMEIQTLKEKLH